VLEGGRPNRQLRHQHRKTDHLDAEGGARAVLGGQANALPKSGTSTVEMIRHFRIARDTAVKARTQAMPTLKAIIISVPVVLREQLDAVTGKMALLGHLAALRPGHVVTPTASTKTSLRSIARRWVALDEEIKAHDAHLEQLTKQCAPTLVEAHGIKAHSAAERLLLVGDNPERIHSEAALAKLCGPAQSQPPAVRPVGIASTVVAIAKPMQVSTALR
jgi:transposase